MGVKIRETKGEGSLGHQSFIIRDTSKSRCLCRSVALRSVRFSHHVRLCIPWAENLVQESHQSVPASACSAAARFCAFLMLRRLNRLVRGRSMLELRKLAE